ncbi:OLC1v1029015C1 [Oldenlandia corymbosa var. corymbosa]|uniref:OLC1v1029015C1 n=1 Tax=Oldenlandia corymbosa var. corymbosa TaxID=529605 RepID=A0AAV1CD27_OLDCO|nr:OLC1v1029015C1 [Oldenlandia corymbosa var. corymbosa]
MAAAGTLSHTHTLPTWLYAAINKSTSLSPSSLLDRSSLYNKIPRSLKLTHSFFDYYSNSTAIPFHSTLITPQLQQMADATIDDAQKLRLEFLDVLRSRRTQEVPLTVIPGEPVKDPLIQETPRPVFSAAMESCPRKEIPDFKELLQEENFYLTTESGEQGRLPVLILSLKQSSPKRRPAVVFLHSTNKCKEWVRPLLEAYASRGYITIAIDSRYHGERASSMTMYRDALVSSWKLGDTMPFIFDTVWDLIKLAEYLTQREDIDPSRIGITGESLGGMHAWFAGAVDTRYSVVVPIIGVQGFRWAIEHDKWQARVDSIKAVFEEARTDLGKSAIDKEVVEKVWNRIAPGLSSKFDSPYTVPIIAPRPLLILNGQDDPRCPIQGLEVPRLKAQKAYEEAKHIDYYEFKAQVGIGHQMTPLMVKEASNWFDRFLLP